MGYDMVGKTNNDHYFRANIWGMGLLRQVMSESGVDFETKSERKTSSEYSQEGTLLDSFCSNDGWWINPEECKEIARKLSEHQVTEFFDLWDKEIQKLSEEQLEFIQKFSKYCEQAAMETDGFYVY